MTCGRSERELSLVGGPSVVLVVATSVDIDKNFAEILPKIARAETLMILQRNFQMKIHLQCPRFIGFFVRCTGLDFS